VLKLSQKIIDTYKNLGYLAGSHFSEQNYQKYTKEECDFIWKCLQLKPGNKILDLGCGTGRHIIELARRGVIGVGVDISKDLLAIGKAISKNEDLKTIFLELDARELPFSSEFDGVISLYTGGFGIMESDEDNMKILESISNSLKHNGKFALMARNAIYCIPREIKKGNRVDYKNNKVCTKIKVNGEKGLIEEELWWFAYTFKELKLLLNFYGLEVTNVYDASIGKFGERDFSYQTKEMLLVGFKK
jgi:SAM-dependent methyltransferase